MGQDAAAPTFNMEQDAAAQEFNMTQDAAAYEGVGLSDQPSLPIDTAGGYTDVILVDQYTPGGTDVPTIDGYAGVGLADTGESAFDGYVQADVMQGAGDHGLGDPAPQAGHLDHDDPDPADFA